MGCGRRPQYEFQHPWGTTRLLACRRRRCLHAFWRGCFSYWTISVPGSLHNPFRCGRQDGFTRARIAVASAWLADLTLLVTWLLRTSTGLLREELKSLQFWSLETCFFLGLPLGASSAASASRARVAATAAEWQSRGGDHRTDRVRRAAHESHLLRRANLSERRPEPGRSEAGQCATTASRVPVGCSAGAGSQQAALRLSALLERGLSRVGVGPAAAFVVNAVVMGLTVCCCICWCSSCSAIARRRSSRAPHGTHTRAMLWSATAAVEPSASLACVAALLALRTPPIGK